MRCRMPSIAQNVCEIRTLVLTCPVSFMTCSRLLVHACRTSTVNVVDIQRGSSVRRLRIFTESTRRRVPDHSRRHAAGRAAGIAAAGVAGRLRQRQQVVRRDQCTGGDDCSRGHQAPGATSGTDARAPRLRPPAVSGHGRRYATRRQQEPTGVHRRVSTPPACRTRATTSITTASRTTSPRTCSSPTTCSPGSPATACASSPSKGLAGDISDVWATLRRLLRQLQGSLDRQRRQAVPRAD